MTMADKPLNVVWFCTDQQRWDTIHGLGNPYIKTPNIDKFLEEGVAFAGHTQAPICSLARSAFLTGRYPRTATKTMANGNEFYSKDEKLVTRLLADHGYICGLSGKLHLTSAQGKMETPHR